MTEKLLPENLDFNGAFPRLSRRLRLGVVGGGRISATQATAARMTDRWDVVAGALSSDPARAKTRGAEWFMDPDRCYTSFEDMAQTEASRPDGVDAVMITTPNNLHFPAAKAFLEAGIDVICDKPLTNEVCEATALIDLASQTGQVFGVGYAMSCFPMIRQAREIVAEGRIGKINQIHVEFLQDWMTPEDVVDAPHVKWRLDPKVSGPTSCVGDIGTHAAHLASFVSGLEMTDLRAEFHVCGAPKPLEDTVFMFTRFQNDVPGTLMATRLAPGNRGGLRLRVYGSEGGVEWDLENSEQLKFYRYGEADQVISRGHGHGVSAATERLVRTARGFPEGVIEAWANLYTEFAMAVAARRDGVAPPDGWVTFPKVAEGAAGVQFIAASVRSNEQGGAWVTI
ncbi:Gfo/Idh/MocA family protein [Aliiroseovarius crassostreae]|uniref:Gfo/Idh/MocA family protein n=1 Tax=Aliiroseovarius crassostreae TaxID=154981 RepID=UPI002207898B|nr:Gfo/Idh/MocA family oxidoreductase [Aliiroseovarius crassostreae]UWP89165.1 Gfo/Idh/MocA family oxidoreductase [Aliiroseovarius crassostreae]UWQ01809.1 Gfo/Idh/MocA family oxidoreductase [Aliiroseovarius crassostreae]